MAFLESNPKNPPEGDLGLGKAQLLNSRSAVIEAIDDEIILKRSLKNPTFFEIIVDRYQDGFLRTAYRVVRSREEAEDIAQEAFVKIYRNGKRFQKRPGATFKSWAYKILMNTAFTRYQKLKKREVNLDEFFDVILFERAEQKHNGLLKKMERQDIVGQALKEIPAELADLVKLHYFEGYSYDDMSELKDLPISTLKMRLYRARKLIKKQLDKVLVS